MPYIQLDNSRFNYLTANWPPFLAELPKSLATFTTAKNGKAARPNRTCQSDAGTPKPDARLKVGTSFLVANF